MERTLIFLVGVLSFSITATASGQKCASIFTPAQTSGPVFTVNFKELAEQQSLVSLTMQFAESRQSNREFNTAMVEVTQVLNRMFDRYVMTLQFARDQMNPSNKDLLLGFIKQNQDFFSAFLRRPPEELVQFLQSRANALALAGQRSPTALPSIGFIQNPSQAAETAPMASIGFIQNAEQGKGARPLETIGFIQPSPGSNNQAPVKKLPTIGFIQPQEGPVSDSTYVPQKVDVGYRLEIVFNPKFGVFEVRRQKAP